MNLPPIRPHLALYRIWILVALALAAGGCQPEPRAPAKVEPHASTTEAPKDNSAVWEPPLEWVLQPHADASTALVVLHGYGADEHDLLGAVAALNLPLHVISLRGPHDMGQGRHAWFPLRDGPQRYDPEDVAASTARITDVVEHLDTALEHPIHKVVLLGFSQGAMMANEVALRHPDLVAGVVSLSGLVPAVLALEPDVAKAKDLPVLVVHGSADELVPLTQAHTLHAALEARGAQVELFIVDGMAHRITPEVLQHVASWLEPLTR